VVLAIFAKKNSSFRLPYQRLSSSADCARELFNGFLLVLAESVSFVYISVCLIHQLAQFVTGFYPLEVFCSVNMSFAVSLLMSQQLVRVGIQTN